MKNQPNVAIFIALCGAVTMAFSQSCSDSDEPLGLETVQWRCLTETGPNEAFHRILEKFQTGAECVASRFNRTGLLKEMQAWQDSDQTRSVPQIQRRCPRAEELEDCYTPFIIELRKCMTEEQIMPELKQLPQLAEYLCNTSSLEINAIPPAIETCKDRMNITNLQRFDPEDCNEWDQFRGCVKRELSEWTIRRSRRLFAMFYWSLVMNSSCRSMSTTDESEWNRISLYDNIIQTKFFEARYGRNEWTYSYADCHPCGKNCIDCT